MLPCILSMVDVVKCVLCGEKSGAGRGNLLNSSRGQQTFSLGGANELGKYLLMGNFSSVFRARA